MLIVALGDSLTAGFPFEPFSWTRSLEELPARVHNAGLNGDTLAGMLLRLERDVLERRPEVCFVMGGSNDAFQGRSLTAMQDDAAEIRTRVEAAGILTVWGPPPPSLFGELEERLEPFRSWIRARHERVLDFGPAFGTGAQIEPENLPDGVHPSRAAYERMGRIALDFFRDLKRTFD